MYWLRGYKSYSVTKADGADCHSAVRQTTSLPLIGEASAQRRPTKMRYRRMRRGLTEAASLRYDLDDRYVHDLNYLSKFQLRKVLDGLGGTNYLQALPNQFWIKQVAQVQFNFFRRPLQ